MENEQDISGTGIVEVVKDPITPDPPAEQADPPAPDAEEQKSEETPEQKEARRESRRSRARARDAARIAAAETEARMLREQLNKQQAPQAETEPKRDDFESLEDFNRALARYTAKEEAQKLLDSDRKERQAQEERARTRQSDERIAKEWGEREAALRKEAKDYDEVVPLFIEGELSDLDPVARRAILESDLGPQILYHLAKNEAEAERIAKLSPTRQVIELGRLEEKVKPSKKQSDAPGPVSQVRGRSAMQGYSESMSDAEYRAMRKAQGARWAQ